MKKLVKIAVATWVLFSFGSSGQTGSNAVTITALSIPRSIQFSPDGKTLYLGTVFSEPRAEDGIKREDTIEAHDSKTGILIRKYKFDCAPHCYNAPLVISKNGKEIYTSIETEKEVLIQKINISNNEIQKIKNEKLKFIYAGHGLSISNNSKYLVIGGYYIYIYNTVTGNIFSKIVTHKNYPFNTNVNGMITDVQFSNGDKFFASVEKSGVIAIWNPETGERIRQMDQPYDSRYSISISPDDRFITTSGYLTNQTCIWDVKTGKVVVTYKPSKKGAIISPVFSPNGRFIASSEPDGVWLRDAKTAKKIKSIPELFDSTQEMSLLSFSPNGNYLASVSRGGRDGNGIIRVIPFNY